MMHLRLLKVGWHAWWTGLLVTVPATATVYILWRLFRSLNALSRDLLGPFVGEHVPGMSLLLLIMLVLLTGFLATKILGQRMVTWAEAAVERIPIVRSIYLTLKGMTDLINFRNRFGHSTVVVFPFPRDRTWALGLVMGTAPLPVERATGATLSMVFVPTAIHPFTGYLAFVPTHTMTPLAIPVEEALKVEFSAGLYRPEGGWLMPASPSQG